MATRLDRLLLLLSSGASPAIRAASARQLGDIAAQRLHNSSISSQDWLFLITLIAKVLPLLRNKSWDSRIAAANAIDALCSAVPRWSPDPNASLDAPPPALSTDISLSDFDLSDVVSNYPPLVASSGAEFARPAASSSAFSSLADPENLAKAKKDVASKLGLGFGIEDDLGIDVAQELSAPQIKSDPDTPPAPAEQDQLSHLSVRERLALKRKRKTTAKAGSLKVPRIDSSRPPHTPNPDTPPPIDAPDSESPPSEPSLTPGSWPFDSIVQSLSLDLFSPRWETRHGACLALREILKSQGAAGGMLDSLSESENSQRHKSWCEDIAAKLLYVFALDRFGDYVSDQVVAPVRETASQTMAALLVSMPSQAVVNVLSILIDMISQTKLKKSDITNSGPKNSNRSSHIWEVRHAGFLGLKYLVATKSEVFSSSSSSTQNSFILSQEHRLDMLSSVIEVCKLGLQDSDDDVRSVAASTLLPIASTIVENLPDSLQNLFEVIWENLRCLSDDLSSSISAVMDLLSTFVAIPEVQDLVFDRSQGRSLEHLVPLLYPFFRHTIVSVRLTIVKTINLFVSISFQSNHHNNHNNSNNNNNNYISPQGNWLNDNRLYRLLFQNLIVEERDDIRDASLATWSALLDLVVDPTQQTTSVDSLVQPYLENWFAIASTAIGSPLDLTLFFSAQSEFEDSATRYNVDKSLLAQDLSLVSVERIMKGRVCAARALAELIARWPDKQRQSIFENLLLTGLRSESCLHRFLTATIIEEWVHASRKNKTKEEDTVLFCDENNLSRSVSNELVNMLLSDPPQTYTERINLHARLYNQCAGLIQIFNKKGKIPLDKLPILPPPLSIETFTLQEAQSIVMPDKFDPLVKLISKKTSAVTEVNDCRKSIITEIGLFQMIKERQDVQLFAAVGAAVVAVGAIPPKLSPLIKSIMNSIKGEENEDLQLRSSRAMASFILACGSPLIKTKLKTNPADKIIKNLCTFLCQDPTETPVFMNLRNTTIAIITLAQTEADKESEKKNGGKKGTTSKTSSVTASASEDWSELPEETRKAKINARGAQSTLEALSRLFEDDLINQVPKLWACMTEAINKNWSDNIDIKEADKMISTATTTDPTTSSDALTSADSIGQGLIDCMTILPTILPSLSNDSKDRVIKLLPNMSKGICSKFAVIRYATARGLSRVCQTLTTEGLKYVVLSLLPLLNDSVNIDNRRGVIELVSHLVRILDDQVLPFVIFLVVPVLGRMTDSDDSVRLLATNTFASLIKLVPLEAGLPTPSGFSQEMIVKRDEERAFLSQLLDGSKIDKYEIPIKIKVDLRKYQREGVSWMAFLARYGLHGVLCDDMGLGKTLQSICILASKTHERKEKFKETQSPDSCHLPSLVLCPSTLTRHWEHEILTYTDCLKPLLYVGEKTERSKLVKKMENHDVVITSYDVARNDIEVLSKFNWSYCILDEGHIIKNGKTKLSKAIKSIRANHRLILSGTPIQNNVLELWSLFDFLMPGYLGSESLFNEKFSKPILASRDAKSSSKEKSAGAMALESLHKQVLPFLLRRMKEDVLDDLPPKIIQDYYCDLSDLQKAFYDDFSRSDVQKEAIDGLHDLDKIKEEEDDNQDNDMKEDDDDSLSDGKKGKQQHVFQALQYMRKLVNHPLLVYKDTPQHQNIVKRFGSRNKDGKSPLEDISNAPKLTALKQILNECGIGNNSASAVKEESEVTEGGAVSNHRVLIFCQLTRMIDIIEQQLFKGAMPGVTYSRMDGSIPPSKRHSIVQTFNADPSIDVLLLTTSVGGLGLNLTAADTVIFVEHDWNPMKDLQAMDRAHRLGQKRVVNVYRLITRDTLEEKVMSLQQFKLNIASTVVSQQNSNLASMDTGKVLDLFNVSATSEEDAKRQKEQAAAESSKNQKTSSKGALDGLQELHHAESEYADFDAIKFAKSLSK